MRSISRLRLAAAAILFALCVPAFTSSAQINIGGAIVKFRQNQRLTVDGTLNVNGTTPSPAILTAYTDDSAGGDTNGDGPSVGTPGYWVTVRFNTASDASVVRGCEIRYGGRTSATTNASVEIYSSDVTLDGCTLRDGTNFGIDFNLQASAARVMNTAIDNHTQVAVWSGLIDTVPGLTNNTASGNAAGNYISIYPSTVGANLTITAANCLGGALVTGAFNVVLPTGANLIGAKFGLQTLTLSSANPTRGNVTNLYRATLRP